MELDDLKQVWNKAIDEPLNTNIMKAISTNPQNPLALLQKKLKYNFYIFPFVVVLFAGHFFSHSTAPGMWLLFGILLTEFIFYAYSYAMVKNLQQTEGRTRDNLLYRVNNLRQTIKWQLIINEVLYIIMAIVLEVTMYNHWDTRFKGWYSVALIWRLAFYAAALIGIFLLKRSSNQKQYGQYINKLSGLLKQAE